MRPQDNKRQALRLESLERRLLLAAPDPPPWMDSEQPATPALPANEIVLRPMDDTTHLASIGTPIVGSIEEPGAVDEFEITLAEAGRLTIQAYASENSSLGSFWASTPLRPIGSRPRYLLPLSQSKSDPKPLPREISTTMATWISLQPTNGLLACQSCSAWAIRL